MVYILTYVLEVKSDENKKSYSYIARVRFKLS